MKITSHLLSGVAFGSVAKTSEVDPAARPTAETLSAGGKKEATALSAAAFKKA